MIRITDFLDSLKISWICCYAVAGIDDHWYDILHTRLDLTPETRNVLNWSGVHTNLIKQLTRESHVFHNF